MYACRERARVHQHHMMTRLHNEDAEEAKKYAVFFPSSFQCMHQHKPAVSLENDHKLA